MLNPNAVSLLENLLQTKSVIIDLINCHYGDKTDEELSVDVEYQQLLKVDDELENLLTIYQEKFEEEFDEVINK